MVPSHCFELVIFGRDSRVQFREFATLAMAVEAAKSLSPRVVPLVPAQRRHRRSDVARRRAPAAGAHGARDQRAKMKKLLIATALAIAVTAAARAGERAPLPVPSHAGVCPSGYSASPTSGMCTPNPNTRQNAVPQDGYKACPPGYHSSMQSFCVKNGSGR